MNHEQIGIIQSEAGLVADVRSMIEQTREGVARAVNAGMTLLYWRIGKRIQTEVLRNERGEYGKGIVHSLIARLSLAHFQRIIALKDELTVVICGEFVQVRRGGKL
ncbi:MAG: DUF1016 N-terminal domain-containing protein [Candidatus Kapaibacterium sp.]